MEKRVGTVSGKRGKDWLKNIVEVNDRHEGKVCGEEKEQDS